MSCGEFITYQNECVDCGAKTYTQCIGCESWFCKPCRLMHTLTNKPTRERSDRQRLPDSGSPNIQAREASNMKGES